MELTTQQLEKLKQLELALLARFIDVCNRLELHYFLLGGTLLGAVRHQGFIPWDDDIDVGMPREDYERFLAHGQEYMPEGFFIQSFITDPGYPANFAKIRNSNTTFLESSLRNCKINHGVYIDVFPLDYYPDKGIQCFELKKLLLTLRISYALVSPNMKKKTRLVRLVTRMIYPSVEKAVYKREALFRSVKTGQKLANYCGAWGKKEIVPAHWYGDGVTLQFEGMEVTAPAEYHKWLTQVYGDYMQLPPPEKRKGHHYVDVVDLEKSYTCYTQR